MVAVHIDDTRHGIEQHVAEGDADGVLDPLVVLLILRVPERATCPALADAVAIACGEVHVHKTRSRIGRCRADDRLFDPQALRLVGFLTQPDW